MEIGMLPPSIGTSIIKASEEVINGQFLDKFIMDNIQGGAGTSIFKTDSSSKEMGLVDRFRFILRI
jgi:aspartate ammonia-lyase